MNLRKWLDTKNLKENEKRTQIVSSEWHTDSILDQSLVALGSFALGAIIMGALFILIAL